MTLKSTLKRLALAVAAGALASTPALAQEVVKIGYSGPLSGGAALYGKNVLDGMQMAASEINAAGFDVGGGQVAANQQVDLAGNDLSGFDHDCFHDVRHGF